MQQDEQAEDDAQDEQRGVDAGGVACRRRAKRGQLPCGFPSGIVLEGRLRPAAGEDSAARRGVELAARAVRLSSRRPCPDDLHRVTDDSFSLRKIAVPAFGPSFLFGLGEGAILPVIALTVRQLGGSVALAALMVTLIGIGSLVTNIPASMITTRYGERWAIVGAGAWGALGMALCVLAPNLVAFGVGVFMVGMASAVFGLARQSYLTETVPFRYRARALSTLGGVMRIGLFLGPFVAAGLIHVMGIGGAYWAGVGALDPVGRRRVAHARPAGACGRRRDGRSRRASAPRRRCARSAPATPRSFSPSASARCSSPRCARRARR